MLYPSPTTVHSSPPAAIAEAPPRDVADEILDELQRKPEALLRAWRAFPGKGRNAIDVERLTRAVLAGRFEI